MALPECVEGVLAAAQVLVHIASTLVQASLGKSGQNGLQQCRVVALGCLNALPPLKLYLQFQTTGYPQLFVCGGWVTMRDDPGAA
eukprot:1152272-Pelagomonas_calceolata.AAC.15